MPCKAPTWAGLILRAPTGSQNIGALKVLALLPRNQRCCQCWRKQLRPQPGQRTIRERRAIHRWREWLGPHNKHGALIAHALVGGAHFDSHTYPQDAQGVGFYNDQTALAAIIGGHMDLNRSAHWVFRITPDAVMTHYGINYPPNIKQYDVNFAISVGVEYKFNKKR